MIEKAVTSVAVPEVEEMAQKCALRRSGGMPNTLHISSNVMSGYSYLIHMALAASMGEPPPIATIQSGWNFSHCVGTLHDRLHGRVGLDAFKQLYLHAGFL